MQKNQRCKTEKKFTGSYTEVNLGNRHIRSTLLVDEEAPSLLFFIFLSPLSLKSLFAGERFGMVQQHLQRDGWQLTSDRPSEPQTTQQVRHVRSPIDQ